MLGTSDLLSCRPTGIADWASASEDSLDNSETVMTAQELTQQVGFQKQSAAAEERASAVALFRHEAVDAQRAKIWGDVTFSLPRHLTLTTGFLVACVVALTTFIATATYARREHVPGFLAARLGVATVLAQRPGIVEALYVKEGQFVEKGAPLLLVNVEQARQSGGGADSDILASLRQQGARYSEQIELERRRAEVEGERLKAEIDGVAAEPEAIEQQLRLQTTRTQMAREHAATMEFLAKRGSGTQTELKTRQDALVAAQQAELTISRTLAEKRKELGLRRADLAQLPISTEQHIAQLRASISEVEAKITQTDGQRAYIIKAPKSGWITTLQAWTGKSVETNIPLMSIVPQGDTLTAEPLCADARDWLCRARPNGPSQLCELPVSAIRVRRGNSRSGVANAHQARTDCWPPDVWRAGLPRLCAPEATDDLGL
ncbi:HlyD family secretion protein [Methylobacterium sp. P31]